MATTFEIHADTIICPDCGHDCNGVSDCGDICICVEEVEEESLIDHEEHAYWDRFREEEQAAYDDEWGDPLDMPSYGS